MRDATSLRLSAIPSFREDRVVIHRPRVRALPSVGGDL
jgi:hypothetical protein